MTSKDLGELNQLLKRRWDRIAPHYYSTKHRTTRNFDSVVDFYFQRYLRFLPEEGTLLDLGAGAGSLHRILARDRYDIVLGDISKGMLRNADKSQTDIPRVQLSAFNLPFQSGVFEAVVSALGDSFSLPEAIDEVFRCLKVQGTYVMALPSYQWGSTLRKHRGIRSDITVFADPSSGEVELPSFLYPEPELRELLEHSGFRVTLLRSFPARGVIPESEISELILEAAENLAMSALDLPIITMVIAMKK